MVPLLEEVVAVMAYPSHFITFWANISPDCFLYLIDYWLFLLSLHISESPDNDWPVSGFSMTWRLADKVLKGWFCCMLLGCTLGGWRHGDPVRLFWPHWGKGRWDRTSTLQWRAPLWWITLKFYSWSCLTHKVSWPSGSQISSAILLNHDMCVAKMVIWVDMVESAWWRRQL